MPENKTIVTARPVADFIAAVEPETRREEAQALDALFRKVTGFHPKMWGPTIIGYGRYTYRYESGHGGEMCATGFSPRAKEISIYILPGYQDYQPFLNRLGKHRTGKSCLYVKRLPDIDMAVLGELIAQGVKDLSALWPVEPE
ncbi:MAG: hypothetical protein RLZZ528_2902 [Pseudomonadota bacterium]